MIILAAPDAGTTTLFVAAVLCGLAALGVAAREVWRAGRTRAGAPGADTQTASEQD